MGNTVWLNSSVWLLHQHIACAEAVGLRLQANDGAEVYNTPCRPCRAVCALRQAVPLYRMATEAGITDSIPRPAGRV